jgi:CBS domain-containing protein
MNVRDLMTADPACCTPETSLEEAAKMMVDCDCDCGAVPVVEDGRPVGVVTDRDMVTRLVARGRCPLEATAADAMSTGAVTVEAGASVDDAATLMKERQLRRLVVVDGAGKVAGVLAQADLARKAGDRQTGDVVEKISEPAR